MLAAGVLLPTACGGQEGLVAVSSPARDTPVAPLSSAAGSPQLPVVMDAWVRMPAAGQTTAAAYVTFVNPGDVDVALLGVTSSTGEAELHETVADADGVMRMQHRRDGFVVPAGGELVMAPGGIHVMLGDVDVLGLALVDAVELTFDFGPLGPVVAAAVVRNDTVRSGHDHAHDDHAHDDHRSAADVDPDRDVADAADERADVTLDTTLDPNRLHDLDDELHAGVFDPVRQRALVAGFRAGLEALAEIPPGFARDALIDVLDRLDAALAAADLDAARALAFEAHDLAHGLAPHGHTHGH